MNIKTIIVGSLALGLLIGGTLLTFNANEEKAVYTPRSIHNGLVTGAAGHAEYMHMLRMDPATGKVDPVRVQQVRDQIALMAKTGNNKSPFIINNNGWTQMGPDDQGGRTRAILVDQSNPNIVYAGSVAGGLFRSTDAGNNWAPISGQQGTLGACLSISCLTQTDNGRIFFGTGSEFEGHNGNGEGAQIGNGVYEYVPSTGDVLPVIGTGTVPQTSVTIWEFTNDIASYGNRLYIGTTNGMLYADPTGPNNINGQPTYPTVISQAGGWYNAIENIPSILETGSVSSIDVHANGSIIVGFSGKIYTAPNDGNFNLGPFTKHTVGLGTNRTSVSVAPSNSNVMYYVGTNNLGNMTTLRISLDKGLIWQEIVPGGSAAIDPMRRDGSATTGQGGYDQCIDVNPADWGNIMVGGIRMFEWQYNPTSNPIGGSWLLASTLGDFQNPFSPYDVHADKHAIEWTTANTIYIGSDGGVDKSTDGGTTWFEKNYGYNTVTFYDAVISDIGWLLGGSQDNGDLMFTYQSFGELSPLGTIDLRPFDGQTYGDGFDVAFSSHSGGIAYGTAQFGALWRTSQTSAGGGFWDPELFDYVSSANMPFHTVIENWESNYDVTSVDTVMVTFTGPDTLLANEAFYYNGLTSGMPLAYYPPVTMFVDTTDTLYLQDYIQNRFAYATPVGVYLTREAARLASLTNEWNRIGLPIGNIICMEFSADGNHLFVGTSGGVRRYSNLNAGNDSLALDIRSGVSIIPQPVVGNGISSGTTGLVTGIACDPNNIDNIIVTTGGYSTANKVYKCTNATTAMTFTSIQGDLPKMPAYEPEIDFNDNNKLIVGTDFGVWTLDNAFTPGPYLWTDESGIVGHTPVMAVEQITNRVPDALFPGRIVLGTHGRGFFITSDLETGIDDNDDFLTAANNGFVSNLNIYPNPLNNVGMLEFDLNVKSETKVNIYNLVGTLVKTMDLGVKPKGNHKIKFNASELSVGTYILSLESGIERSVAKFIVTR